ncbi:hypothetical protein [Roseibium sp.]|uniref:hypothetical protein n=1 Tax=Roseibium sp. TaxID=1936156 RepID=UPI003B51EBA3
MTTKPHITRHSPDSLREFAARRRKCANKLLQEINTIRKQARGLRQVGKAFHARNLEQIADAKQRNHLTILKAAASAEVEADRMERVGEFELKEAAQ